MPTKKESRTTIVVDRNYIGKQPICDLLIKRMLEKNNAPFFAHSLVGLYNESDKSTDKACCSSKEAYSP